MKFRSLMWLIVGFLVAAASIWAQETRATMTGTVTDPSGAVVPGASIATKNLETNVTTTAVTNEAGLYTTEPVNPGQYSVTVSKVGFKTVVQSNVELRQASHLNIDFKLDVGGTADTVLVSADATLLETQVSTQQTVINKQLVQDLPTYADDPYYIVNFTAGIQQLTAKPSQSMRPFDGGETSFNINGAGSNESLLDGATNTARESTGISPGIIAPTDAVGEITVITNLYDAQYGRTGGGVVSATLKSGTNSVHGSTWWFNRNPVFNANTFDSNAAGQPKASYKLNEVGTTLGGPVYFPKIYDGRNRTFFQYTYERFRDDRPQASSSVTPTALESVGDFSKTYVSGTGGPTVAIYDPLTAVVTTSPSLAVTRTPFAGGIIPSNRINPIAAGIASKVLRPNVPNTARGVNNLILAPNYDHEPYDIHIFRLDQNLGSKNKFFVDVDRSNRHQTNGIGNNYEPYAALDELWLSTSYSHWRIQHGVTANVTTVISPSVVSTATFAWNRHQFAIYAYSLGYDPKNAGWSASAFAGSQNVGFPALTIANYGGIGRASSTLNFSNNYSARENILKTAGKHTLHFGAEARAFFNNQSSPQTSGAMSFSTAFTQATQTTSTAAGDAWASFLLGFPSATSSPYNNTPAQGQRAWNAFVQDDWRIGKKLTLNFGLRWDYESPITDRFDHQIVGFDPSTVTNLGGASGPPVKGGLQFASGSHRFAYNRDLNNFGPRVGFAYQPNSKMVVRGGWGIIYAATVAIPPTSGFSTSTTPATSVDNLGYVPLTPAGCAGNTCGMLTTPFPTGINQPPGGSAGLQTFVGQSISFYNPNRVIPYTHSLSVGVQYELPWRSVVELSWNATLTRKGETSFNMNSVTYAQYYQNLWPNGNNLTGTTVANPYQGLAAGTTLNNATMSLQQSLLPYPQFTGITENGLNLGTNNYESIQIRFEKRLSDGLTVLANTTLAEQWNHNSYLNSGLDPLGAFITQNALIQPWVVNLSLSYKFPFFNKSRDLTRAALGGWQIALTDTWFAGPAITVGSVSYTGVNPSIANSNYQKAFNTCTLNNLNVTNAGGASVLQNCSAGQPVAFIINKPGTLLTSPNPQFNGLRAHNPQAMNFSLFKSFKMNEHFTWVLRAEAYNATNSAYFGLPNTTATSSLFGVTSLAQQNDPRTVQLSLKVRY